MRFRESVRMSAVALGMILLGAGTAPTTAQQPPAPERRIVRSITFAGVRPLTGQAIRDRFKERAIDLAVEQPYDPVKVARAVTALEELLTEQGRTGVKVQAETRDLPPRSVEINFRVQEIR